jgi:hypothetical protein
MILFRDIARLPVHALRAGLGQGNMLDKPAAFNTTCLAYVDSRRASITRKSITHSIACRQTELP